MGGGRGPKGGRGETLKEFTPVRRSLSGTKQSSRKMLAFCTQRRGDLVLDLGGTQPLHALAQDEGIDFPSGHVAGPVDYDVGEGGVAYPPLSPVQDPAPLHLYTTAVV